MKIVCTFLNRFESYSYTILLINAQMKKIFSPIPLMLLVVCAFGTQSSQKIDRTLVWEAPKTIFISPKIAKTVQLFEGASYSYDRTGYLPVYFERFKVTAFGDVKVTITNATYEVVENFDFDTDESLIKENFGAEGVLTIERKQPFASVTIIPFRENKFLGLYERLISFSIEIIVIPNNKYNNLNSSSSRKKTASAVSVLGQGNWYKFSVDADGVYKLDYSFMQGMMSDAEIKNINLNLLSIYGNGGVMLPEANSEFRFSDLQENAIKVVDKNNNKKFDTDDYILFYGQSPHIWFLDTSDQRFHHSMNIYTD